MAEFLSAGRASFVWQQRRPSSQALQFSAARDSEIVLRSRSGLESSYTWHHFCKAPSHSRSDPNLARHGGPLLLVSSGWSSRSSKPFVGFILGRRCSVWNEVRSNFGFGDGVATSSATARKEVQFPPADFDFRAETREETLDVVSGIYPELMDLVEDGTLLVVKRPEDYKERRVDGYREPETVFVVGTAHMSLVSAAQVERVVEAVRPENVVVELCRSRVGIMYEDSSAVGSNESDPGTPQEKKQNLMSLSGDSFGAAISRTLRLGGRSALVLRLLLGGMSQKISKSAGVATGAEFRAARKAAEEIGSQLVLGDRPIEVTLQRAWESLKWNERISLASIFLQAMLSSDLDTSEEALQVLKSDDALSAMFTEMGQRLPSLLQPLVYERDMYLAWSLKRSKAVNGCSRVVGVVGRGHMRGVVYNLKYNQENLRFKDLVGTQESEDKRSKGEKLITNLLIETAIGGVLWYVWAYYFGK